MDASDVAAVVLGALTAVTTWWAQRERSRRRKAEGRQKAREQQSAALLNALRGQANIYGTLALLRDQLGADRILLLAAHNGGDRIEQVGTRLFISILAEVSSDDTPQVLKDWDARRVTRDYLGFLLALRRKKLKRLTTAELHKTEHQHMRALYERDGLTCSLVCEIGTTRGKYWYLSASFRDPREFTDGEAEAMASAAVDLLDILELDVMSSYVTNESIEGEP